MSAASTKKELVAMAIDNIKRDTDVFEFFALPREIRDEIYGLLHEEKSTPAHLMRRANTMSYWGRVPVVRSRLISRQFRLEYDDLPLPPLPLHLLDHPAVLLEDGRDCSAVPAWAIRATSLRVTFLVTWAGDETEPGQWYNLAYGMDWLRIMLVKLNKLSKIEVIIRFEKRRAAFQVWERVERGITRLIEAFPTITCVRAVTNERSFRSVRDVEKRVALWTADQGLVIDEAEVNDLLDKNEP